LENRRRGAWWTLCDTCPSRPGARTANRVVPSALGVGFGFDEIRGSQRAAQAALAPELSIPIRWPRVSASRSGRRGLHRRRSGRPRLTHAGPGEDAYGKRVRKIRVTAWRTIPMARHNTSFHFVTVHYRFHPLFDQSFRCIRVCAGPPPTYLIELRNRRIFLPAWMTELFPRTSWTKHDEFSRISLRGPVRSRPSPDLRSGYTR
jgi:hypothetical protein